MMVSSGQADETEPEAADGEDDEVPVKRGQSFHISAQQQHDDRNNSRNGVDNHERVIAIECLQDPESELQF